MEINKIVCIGEHPKNGRVFIKIKHENGRLSLTGVEGPLPNGNCRGGAGQIEMHMTEAYIQAVKFFAPWDAVMLRDLLLVWRDWHLNDMRAGCEHQRKQWDFSAPLTWRKYHFTELGRYIEQKIKHGDATEQETTAWRAAEAAYTARIGCRNTTDPVDLELAAAVEAGILYPDPKTKTERAGSVYPSQHPDGKLCAPCPVCGYRYGSKWLFEPVPVAVLNWLDDLPHTTLKPAWV